MAKKPINFYHDFLIKHYDYLEYITPILYRHAQDLNNGMEKMMQILVKTLPSTIKEKNDPIMYMVCVEYFKRQKHVYKIAKEFGEVLKDVQTPLSTKMLEKWSGDCFVIDFPFPFISSKGEYIWHVLGTVNIASNEENNLLKEETTRLYIAISAPHYDKNGRRLDSSDVFVINHWPEKGTWQDSLKEKSNLSENNIPGFYDYIANCLLYINSGDPDLRHLKVKPPHKSRDSKWYAKRELTFAASPTVLVGFNWKKANVRHADETVVKAHPRWQPCGKNRGNVKLILVKEHVRNFKKE